MSKAKYLFFEIVRFIVIIVLSPFLAFLYLLTSFQNFISYKVKGKKRITNSLEYEQN